jgi:hypothetical protein
MLTSLAVAVSSTAAIKISTGAQTNWDVGYAVAWKEGEDPCRNDQLLAPVYENTCDKSFLIDSVLCESESCSALIYRTYIA